MVDLKLQYQRITKTSFNGYSSNKPLCSIVSINMYLFGMELDTFLLFHSAWEHTLVGI